MSRSQGDELSVSIDRNCLMCKRRVLCHDPKKNAYYACSKFEPFGSSKELTTIFDNTLSSPKAVDYDDDENIIGPEEDSILTLVEGILSSGVPVPPDLKFDDRHILRPKNIFEWMTEPGFITKEDEAVLPPFPRQVQVGLHALSEYCPHCTDMDWFETLEVDDPLDEIADRVVMLEYGVCPECGITKSELVAEEELNDPFEIVGLAGQRCVVGDTMVPTIRGRFSIRVLAGDIPYGVHVPYKGPAIYRENNEIVVPSHVFRVKPEPIYTVYAGDGFNPGKVLIRGTKDHPIAVCTSEELIKNYSQYLVHGADAPEGYVFITLGSLKVLYEEFLFSVRCNGKRNAIYDVQIDEPEDTYDFVVPMYHRFIANDILNHNSSKTITATMISSYNTARWLLTPNIPATFNLHASTVFTGTYTATSFDQAKENFWRPLAGIFRESAWFNTYNKFLVQTGYEQGTELLAFGEASLYYKHKNLFYSPVSPSKRGTRGRTRIDAAIDEIGWFPVGKTKAGKDFERLDAKEVFTSLNNSLKTLKIAYRNRLLQGYSNLPKPMITAISSPQALNDAIMTLYRASIGSREIYSFKYATWDFNPHLKREDFKEEYRKAAVDAERDYACNPPLNSRAWVKDADSIVGSFAETSNGVTLIQSRVKTKNSKLLTTASLKPNGSPKSNYKSVLALDAGYVNNSFTFAVCFPKTLLVTDDDEDEEEELEYVVEVDVWAVGEIIPNSENPISFTRLYSDVLVPLIELANVGAVISDRWQNIKMLQDLEENTGVAYFEHRLKYAEMKSFKEDGLYDNKIHLPRLEFPVKDIIEQPMDAYPSCFNRKPVSHLMWQCLNVQDLGSSVEKGDGTDDILRAVALGFTACQLPDVHEFLLPDREFTTPKYGLSTSSKSAGHSSGRSGSTISVVSSASGGGGFGPKVSSAGIAGGSRRR